MRQSAGITETVLEIINGLELLLARPPYQDTAVHKIRVNIKKLRAWTRLVRTKSDKKNWRSLDHGLRDLQKLFSAERDRKVVADSLEWMQKKADSSDTNAAVITITRHFSALSAPYQMAEPQGVNIRDLLDTLKQNTLSVKPEVKWKKALKRTFRRARELGHRACSKESSPDDLHRFRKWVKYLYYQTGFVQVLHHGDYDQVREQLGNLEKLLGRIHDLVLVKQRLQELAQQSEWRNPVAVTNEMIDSLIKKWTEKAGQLMRKLFSQSPGNFVKAPVVET